jgi:hypothetical protein
MSFGCDHRNVRWFLLSLSLFILKIQKNIVNLSKNGNWIVLKLGFIGNFFALVRRE